MKSKKAISPVVAVSLLLTIAVVSGVGFQSWLNNYSQTIQTNIEKKDSTPNMRIEGIIGDKLYIRSYSNQAINIFRLQNSSGDEICSFSDNTSTNFGEDTILLMSLDNHTINGSIFYDYSYYKHNGTIINDAYFDTGINGDGMHIDGDSDRIEVTSDISPYINNSFSISMWIYPRNNDASNSNSFISKGNAWLATGNGFYMLHDDASSTFQFRLTDGTASNQVWMTTNATFPINNWYHIVGVFSSNNFVKLYVNNEIALENNSIAIDKLNSYTAALYIGSTSTNSLNGTIDEVAIYSKALTAWEVESLYEGQKAKLYEQILGDGAKEIDISDCNVVEGESYQIVAFTGRESVYQEVIAK